MGKGLKREETEPRTGRVSSEAVGVQGRGCGVLILVAEGREVVRGVRADSRWREGKRKEKTRPGRGVVPGLGPEPSGRRFCH